MSYLHCHLDVIPVCTDGSKPCWCQLSCCVPLMYTSVTSPPSHLSPIFTQWSCLPFSLLFASYLSLCFMHLLFLLTYCSIQTFTTAKSLVLEIREWFWISTRLSQYHSVGSQPMLGLWAMSVQICWHVQLAVLYPAVNPLLTISLPWPVSLPNGGRMCSHLMCQI